MLGTRDPRKRPPAAAASTDKCMPRPGHPRPSLATRRGLCGPGGSAHGTARHRRRVQSMNGAPEPGERNCQRARVSPKSTRRRGLPCLSPGFHVPGPGPGRPPVSEVYNNQWMRGRVGFTIFLLREWGLVRAIRVPYYR
jgi:hypothetical protein